MEVAILVSVLAVAMAFKKVVVKLHDIKNEQIQNEPPQRLICTG